MNPVHVSRSANTFGSLSSALFMIKSILLSLNPGHLVHLQEHHIYFFALPAWPENSDEETMNEDGTVRITVAERDDECARINRHYLQVELIKTTKILSKRQ
eukprot:1158895-Pelagomonas_calceolata.AAC.6